MQPTSPNKRPYYLSYGEPAWYRDEIEFPEGRHPDRDLFSLDAVLGIVSTITRDNSVDLGALQRALRGIARSFLSAALTTPLGLAGGPENKTRDERVRWLSSHVRNPARKLIEALSDVNTPMFSEWPETIDAAVPDKAVLRTELQKLLERAEELAAVLEDRKRDRNEFVTEFRADLANALTDIFEQHFPKLNAARDSYDKTTEQHSAYAEFLRLCVEEIFPDDPALPGHIVDDISRMRGNR